MADEPNTVAASTGLSDNSAGALAYLTVIPAIIFLIVEPYNKNSFVRFNSWQCIFLCCAAIVIDIALGILVYSSAVLLVNACRIQASVALIVPKFRKSTKLA